MARAQVVIVGGGTVGLEAARRLDVGALDADVTVVDPAGTSTYRSLLPEVAGGAIDARHAVVPLRDELRHAHVVDATACGLDPAARRLAVRHRDGRTTDLPYDQLIVAPGSVTKLLPVPGLAEHAIGFTEVSEAVHLRDHVLERVADAAATDDPARRRRALTFLFVGAGYSGVEAAGELQDLAAAAADHHEGLSADDLHVVLVEATGTLLPMVGEGLRRAAERELRGRGVDIRLETTLERVDDGGAHLSDGTHLATDTLVWCAGVRPHPSVADLGLPTTDGGRIEVGPTLAVPGLEGVWAAGDAAAVPDLVAGGLCPPSAQYALRQGRHAAANVVRALVGQPPTAFRYRQLGEMVTLGRLRAVGEVGPLALTGRPAWLLRAAYHVARFPSWQRKARIAVEWTIRLASARDLASLGSAPAPGAAMADAEEAAAQAQAAVQA